MTPKFPLVAGAVLAGALAGAPALAALVYFDVEVPGVGKGRFAYDAVVIDDASGGLYTSPLTAFSFFFNGFTYGLDDAAGPLAWFSDSGVGPTGIQYLGLHNTDSIEFAAGFGAGDMGSFTGNGGAPGGVGPIALTDSDFVRVTADVPEPGALACLLAGLGLAAGRRRVAAIPGTAIPAIPGTDRGLRARETGKP
jgi:hypothetical protein